MSQKIVDTFLWQTPNEYGYNLEKRRTKSEKHKIYQKKLNHHS